MTRRLVIGLLTVSLIAVACVTNRPAMHVAAVNAKYINSVKIGQTMDEVRGTMHKGPESQAVQTLADGTTETTWNYITDYASDTNTTITFRGGKVAGVGQTRWLGNGDFTTTR